MPWGWFDDVSSAVSWTADAIGSGSVTVWHDIGDGASTVLGDVEKVASTVCEGVGEGASAVWNGVGDAASAARDGVGGILGNDIDDFLDNILDDPTSFIPDNMFTELLKNTDKLLKTGLEVHKGNSSDLRKIDFFFSSSSRNILSSTKLPPSDQIQHPDQDFDPDLKSYTLPKIFAVHEEAHKFRGSLYNIREALSILKTRSQRIRGRVEEMSKVQSNVQNTENSIRMVKLASNAVPPPYRTVISLVLKPLLETAATSVGLVRKAINTVNQTVEKSNVPRTCKKIEDSVEKITNKCGLGKADDMAAKLVKETAHIGSNPLLITFCHIYSAEEIENKVCLQIPELDRVVDAIRKINSDANLLSETARNVKELDAQLTSLEYQFDQLELQSLQTLIDVSQSIETPLREIAGHVEAVHGYPVIGFIVRTVETALSYAESVIDEVMEQTGLRKLIDTVVKPATVQLEVLTRQFPAVNTSFESISKTLQLLDQSDFGKSYMALTADLENLLTHDVEKLAKSTTDESNFQKLESSTKNATQKSATKKFKELFQNLGEESASRVLNQSRGRLRKMFFAGELADMDNKQLVNIIQKILKEEATKERDKIVDESKRQAEEKTKKAVFHETVKQLSQTIGKDRVQMLEKEYSDVWRAIQGGDYVKARELTKAHAIERGTTEIMKQVEQWAVVKTFEQDIGRENIQKLKQECPDVLRAINEGNFPKAQEATKALMIQKATDEIQTNILDDVEQWVTTEISRNVEQATGKESVEALRQEHQDVWEAVKDGDSAKVQVLAREHLMRKAKKVTEESLKQLQQYTATEITRNVEQGIYEKNIKIIQRECPDVCEAVMKGDVAKAQKKAKAHMMNRTKKVAASLEEVQRWAEAEATTNIRRTIGKENVETLQRECPDVWDVVKDGDAAKAQKATKKLMKKNAEKATNSALKDVQKWAIAEITEQAVSQNLVQILDRECPNVWDALKKGDMNKVEELQRALRKVLHFSGRAPESSVQVEVKKVGAYKKFAETLERECPDVWKGIEEGDFAKANKLRSSLRKVMGTTQGYVEVHAPVKAEVMKKALSDDEADKESGATKTKKKMKKESFDVEGKKVKVNKPKKVKKAAKDVGEVADTTPSFAA